jgi:hypothetical protein
MVAVVVFAELAADDHDDAAAAVARAVTRRLKGHPLFVTDIGGTAHPVDVLTVRELGGAMSSGMLRLDVSPRRVRRGY